MNGLLRVLGFLLLWLLFVSATMGIGLLVGAPAYWALAIRNSDIRAAKAKEKLDSTLMKGETLLGYALQDRVYALLSRRELVAITNSRIIVITRGVLGGFKMRDYQWKDLKNAELEENIIPNVFGSVLSFTLHNSPIKMQVDGLPSDTAAQLYAHAQAQEQAWEEKHRVRSLEEMRAVSGGVVVSAGGGAAAPQSGGAIENLNKAKQLLDSGVISDAEFHELKSKILAGHSI